MAPEPRPPEAITPKPDAKGLEGLPPQLRAIAEFLLALGGLGAAATWFWKQLLKPNSRSDILIGVFAVLLLSGVSLLWRMLQRRLQPRSRFSKPSALNIGKKYLIGRDDDIASLISRLHAAPLVFLIGESGAGKTALLRLGLLPQLSTAANHPFLPVYLDHWGSDWADGPQQALALELSRALEFLDTADRERVGLQGPLHGDQALAVVERLYDELGRIPIFLFDQFDDYHTQHRARFIRGRQRRVLRADQLTQENPFWREVDRLLRAGKARCLFAARADAQLALESVRFPTLEADPYPLDRLDRNYARDLLDELARNAGLVHPQTGFEQLRERLIADLAPDGLVLPAQMRLAFRGLADLSPPTIRSYGRIGGVRGLEALSIEHEIAKAAHHAAYDTSELRLLLLSLVDIETHHAQARSERELLALLPPGKHDPARLAVALNYLRDADLVRQAFGPVGRESLWQLDHPYLSLSLVEIDRRASRWQRFLTSESHTFAVARGPLARWRALLSPTSQLALAYQHLHGRLSYGTARGYALLSTPRLVLNPVIIALAVALFAWSAVQTRTEQQARMTTANQLTGQALYYANRRLDLALLLAAQAYRTANTYDTRSGLLSLVLTEPRLDGYIWPKTRSISPFIFSPDGGTLATGGDDGTLELWDLGKRSRRGLRLSGLKGRLYAAAFSPDGQILVGAGAEDGSLQLWDTSGGRAVGAPLTPPSASDVASLAFSPDGRMLAAGYHGFVVLWDVLTHRVLWELSSVDGWVGNGQVAFRRGGRVLAVEERAAVSLWDVDKHQRLAEAFTLPPRATFLKSLIGVSSLTGLNSENSLAIEVHDEPLGSSSVRVWDTETHQPKTPPLDAHTGGSGFENLVNSAAVSRDGRWLASGDLEGTLMLWYLALPGFFPEERHSGRFHQIHSLAIAADGKTLAASGSDGDVAIWNLESDSALGRPLLGARGVVHRLMADPSGRILAALDSGGVNLWDLDRRIQLGRYHPSKRGDYISSMRFTRNGKGLTLSTVDGEVLYLDLGRPHPISTAFVDPKTAMRVTALEPSGNGLAFAYNDGTVGIWDLEPPRLRETLPFVGDHKWAGFEDATFSPNGHFLAVRRENSHVYLWDLVTHRPPCDAPLSPLGFTSHGERMAFSPDSSILAVSVDLTVEFVDPVQCRLVGSALTGFNSEIQALSFRADGGILAVATNQAQIRLVEMPSRRPLGQPLVHRFVSSLAFSAGGETLFTGGSAGSIYTWDLSPKSWAKRACRRANRNLSYEEWKQLVSTDLPYQRTCPDLPPGKGAPR